MIDFEEKQHMHNEIEKN